MSDLESIQSKIAELEAQAASIKASESAAQLAQVKTTVAAYGFTAEQVFGGKSATRKQFDAEKVSTPAPIKYRGPNRETWSGRGMMPKWMTAMIEEGANKEDFLIEVVAA